VSVAIACGPSGIVRTAFLRLGRLDLSLEDGLAYRKRTDVEIEGAPSEAQQLADSQSRRGDDTGHRPIRFIDTLQ
jgi:hypothetical protein